MKVFVVQTLKPIGNLREILGVYRKESKALDAMHDSKYAASLFEMELK